MSIQSITIFGRRWCDNVGNVYFSASILLNGEMVHRIPYEYGYGDYYVQAAFKWLDENGHTHREKPHGGYSDPPWRYCQDKGIKLHTEAADVGRKRDL